MKIETKSIANDSAEIPGPTRKVPPPKQAGSDTNEISNKASKNQPNSGKDLLTAKTKFGQMTPDYDLNYSSNEEEDFDSSMGELESR